MSHHHPNQKRGLAAPILRDPPVVTPSIAAATKSAQLVRDLRSKAASPLSISEARRLMLAAAEEIERLQQLPLFP